MKRRMHRHSTRAARHGSRARALLILGLFVGILCIIWFAGAALENRNRPQEVRGDVHDRIDSSEIVEYQGQKYVPRNRLTTILLMGVDRREGTEAEAGSYRNGGQADFLMLLAIDDENKRITPIQIDRDTMAQITILGVLGNPSGTRRAQICLSHGFGDGGEESCRYTQTAVSQLFLGVDIDFFLAMNLDGISALNDALGGVTVTLEDDFTSLDPQMAEGTTLTLVGDQAEYYLRSRMNVGIGTNEARMARQRSYLETAADILMERVRDDSNFAGDVYDAIEPYLITDMRRGRVINESVNCVAYKREAMVSPEGEHSVGDDGFMEFEVDPQALEHLVIDTFFEPLE